MDLFEGWDDMVQEGWDGMGQEGWNGIKDEDEKMGYLIEEYHRTMALDNE